MARVDLQDKPIAITGASSGIGAATAIECAKAGMPVALFARRADRLNAVAERIRSGGGRAIVVPGSTENRDDCLRLLDLCEGAFGPLHAVFANAGYGMKKPTHSIDEAEIRRMFEVNFFGSLNVVRPAIERFIELGGGHALMCSSCLSKISMPSYGVYSATKACQDHFGRAMRLELAGTGVYVSTVHPIGTATEFFEAAGKLSGEQGAARSKGSRSMQSPERVARAVVKCLRKPRGEVWTSLPVRLSFALSVAMPGTADCLLVRRARKRAARQADEQSPTTQ